MVQSKIAGCDAVKFQAFEEKMVENHPEASRLIKSSITPSNVNRINQIAESVGIEWFCTPMYLQAVDMLEPFVKRFKVRVSDGRQIVEGESTELFERLIKTNKELIISSQQSPLGTKYYDHPNIKWLYCVPKYPCTLSDLDFRNIRDFDGFSNHCPHLLAPLTAAILGAQIIEVHITSDKEKNFADNNVSFDYKELKELVNLIRLSSTIQI